MNTILVVDDMAIFRDPIAATLRLSGYRTLTAENGKVALEVARREKPAVILLDVSMPVMDGIAALEEVRKDANLADTPVILLTALTDEKILEEAARLGVQDIMIKSRFRLIELTDRIARLMARGPEPVMPRRVAPELVELARSRAGKESSMVM